VHKKDLLLQSKSNKKIEFICPKCGQITASSVRTRTHSWALGNTGCGAAGCYRKGSLKEVYPGHLKDIVDARNAGLRARSKKIIEFKCQLCGTSTLSKVVDRTAAWDRGSTGCSCTGWGYNPLLIGWLYLVKNEEAGLLQIGITNNWKRRLSEHKRNGFLPLDIEKYEDGGVAKENEAKIKKFLAEHLGHSLNERINSSTFSGFTETWSTKELDVSCIRDLCSMVLQ
jgi:predicted RNA-binding Zn-ribbon protein involved in translation (DUF1610 family)